MKKLLIAFALWILKRYKYEQLGELAPYVQLALPLVERQQREYADRSGEAKKHAVYAHLIKELPEASKRDISMAIELAVRSLTSR